MIWEALAPQNMAWQPEHMLAMLANVHYNYYIVKINKQIPMYASLATLFFNHRYWTIIELRTIDRTGAHQSLPASFSKFPCPILVLFQACLANTGPNGT
jgi:hypothetical protein